MNYMTQTHTHTYTNTYTYTHTHTIITHTHTHTHIQSHTYLYVASTLTNKRGLFFTKLVNINSKRLVLNLVMMYRACVLPRKREEALRMLMESTQRRPIPVCVCYRVCVCHVCVRHVCVCVMCVYVCVSNEYTKT